METLYNFVRMPMVRRGHEPLYTIERVCRLCDSPYKADRERSFLCSDECRRTEQAHNNLKNSVLYKGVLREMINEGVPLRPDIQKATDSNHKTILRSFARRGITLNNKSLKYIEKLRLPVIPKSCDIDGCTRESTSNITGLCAQHRSYKRQGKQLKPVVPKGYNCCGANKCEEPRYARGLCRNHSRRIKRGYDILLKDGQTVVLKNVQSNSI